VILSACYALWLYRRVIFGELLKPSLAGIRDMSFREKAILVPLIALTILFGVYPQSILDVTAASVDQLIGNYQAAVQASGTVALQAAR
jgi:NADH-quinone oxidoreductase subunit M